MVFSCSEQEIERTMPAFGEAGEIQIEWTERRTVMEIKHFLVGAAFLLLCSYGVAEAAIYYIAPASEIPVRTGKNNRKKIVAILSDGTRVELLKEEDGWAYIRTQAGKEGWVIKRYLTREQPPRIQLAALRKENQQLREKYEELKRRFQDVSGSGNECQQSLAACIAEKQDIEGQYSALQKDAAEIIQTKKLLAETQKELSRTRALLSATQKKIHDLEAGGTVKWFLAGAGVLLVGWLIGLASGRKKRRRPSLL